MKRPVLKTLACPLGVLLASFIPTHTTKAQGNSGQSLADQLKAQYKVARLATDSTGLRVVETGTVLVVQKGGLLGTPPISAVVCPSTYEAGNLHPPNGFCKSMIANIARFLDNGERVYPLKLEVNSKNDKISLTFIECDACNGATQPSSFRSQIVFHFPKDYLETANAGKVTDTINQVLAFENASGDAQQPQDSQGQQQQQGAQQEQAPPQTIQAGQTIDEVVAALGQPEKIVNLGVKQIYVYKDLKVTFMNGKVSDVQ
jgi:hypothetical protein